MSVKRLYTSEELLVVPQGDEHLSVVPDCLLQHRQRALADLMLFESAKLSLVEL